MMILQAEPISALTQYGVLGIFAALLIGALIAVFKLYTSQMDKRMDALQKELDLEKSETKELRNKFDEYVRNDNKAVVAQLGESTDAIRENTQVLERVKGKL